MITHDHWDHLDYKTILQLKSKVKTTITGLGVGSHFEHWGFDTNSIVEMDWFEKTEFKTLQEKTKLKSLEKKFLEKDIYKDDLSVPKQTIIYYSKTSLIFVLLPLCSREARYTPYAPVIPINGAPRTIISAMA